MYRMIKRPSQMPFTVLEERSKLGSSIHLYVILATLVLVFGLSAFLLTPHQAKPLTIGYPPSLGASVTQQTATAAHAAAAREAAAQAAAAANPAVKIHFEDTCHTEPSAEYSGDDVIEWGSQHLKETAAECCAACRSAKDRGCNVWVWCGSAEGCGGDRKHKECWLKRQRDLQPAQVLGVRGTKWTSGALYNEFEREAQVAAEKRRLEALRKDEDLPLVWLDVAIKGKHIGRIHFVLFMKDSPRAAENFRQLCTGEHGVVPEGQANAGQAYHLKGKPFYRIIHGFIDQAGANTDSVFGGQFKDDPGGLRLKHDRKGLLSMANTGPDTNDSHFSIMINKAPHLDGHYTIFGEAIDGFEAIDAVNALAVGKKDNTATAEDAAMITDSGQIRRGRHKPQLD